MTVGEPEPPESAREERTLLKSAAAFERARRVMPGGVSSPVRSFSAVGGTPIFVREGEGCRIEDIDGNSYIDYVGSYGPLIAGHGNERILAAISKAAGRGTTYGAPTLAEVELAETIISAMPSVEMVRFVNSGTEAVMSTLRLARAATGRNRMIKCIGCYHGHADALLVESGGGVDGHPSSAGVPRWLVENTVLVPFNDLRAARQAFEQNAGEVACFIVEPIAGNMGLVKPREGFLQGLRDLCNEFGALLVFDEVITGFRAAWGGAQSLYGVRPDLTCLGKIIGGGLPAAAYCGPAHLMEQVSPTGPVYQAGTLSGNPVAMAAGQATLDILRDPGDSSLDSRTPYDILDGIGALLEEGLSSAARRRGLPLTINRVGSMLGVYLTDQPDVPIEDFAAVAGHTDGERFARFFHALLERGVMIPPSRFEAWFVGLAHTPDDIEETIDAADGAFGDVAGRL